MEDVIWCWSLKDTNNIILIFRSLPYKEIEIDLRKIYSYYSFNDIKFNKGEQELLKSLIPKLTIYNTCKTCKYLLKTQPNKRIMHKCAVTGKDVTLIMKACEEFKNNYL